MSIFISEEIIISFVKKLIEQERSENTIQKYVRDVKKLAAFADGKYISKELLVKYKSHLIANYSVSSVNSMLAAVNCFLEYFGRGDLRVKLLKIQKTFFSDEKRELQKTEYERLIAAAKTKGNERLMLVVETICSTGIRVSELRFITAEAVESGYAEISCKGKRRTVFLPESLRQLLKPYLEKRGIGKGSIFITRTGKPLDRSNIWRDMKNLCKTAEVSEKKVFPHNLRHLFARTFYSIEKDLLRLADILGHSSINTTRIYTMESGLKQAKLLDKMNLVIMTT